MDTQKQYHFVGIFSKGRGAAATVMQCLSACTSWRLALLGSPPPPYISGRLGSREAKICGCMHWAEAVVMESVGSGLRSGSRPGRCQDSVDGNPGVSMGVVSLFTVDGLRDCVGTALLPLGKEEKSHVQGLRRDEKSKPFARRSAAKTIPRANYSSQPAAARCIMFTPSRAAVASRPELEP